MGGIGVPARKLSNKTIARNVLDRTITKFRDRRRAVSREKEVDARIKKNIQMKRRTQSTLFRSMLKHLFDRYNVAPEARIDVYRQIESTLPKPDSIEALVASEVPLRLTILRQIESIPKSKKLFEVLENILGRERAFRIIHDLMEISREALFLEEARLHKRSHKIWIRDLTK